MINDIELANQMVNVLSKELMEMKTELQRSQMRVSSTTSIIDVGSEQLGDQNDSEVNVKREPLDEALNENVIEVDTQEKESAAAYSILKEKYKSKKEKISRLTQECQALKKSLGELEVKVTKAEAKAAVNHRNGDRATDSDNFDFRQFLTVPEWFVVPSRPKLRPVKFAGTQRVFSLPPAVAGYANAGCLRYSDVDIMWPTGKDVRGLILEPTSIYSAKPSGGVWTQSQTSSLSVGERRELFCRKSQNGGVWVYKGTYRCIRKKIMPYKGAEAFGKSVYGRLKSRTVSSRELVAPIVAQMAESMLQADILQVSCVAIELVGFNRSFHDALQAVVEHKTASASNTSEGNNLKRKHDYPRTSKSKDTNKRRRDD